MPRLADHKERAVIGRERCSTVRGGRGAALRQQQTGQEIVVLKLIHVDTQQRDLVPAA